MQEVPQQLNEFAVGQVWQTNGRLVDRIINAFVLDTDGQLLIRCASPKGRVSRYSVEQMRQWINDNKATMSGIPLPATAKPPRKTPWPVRPIDLGIDNLHINDADRCVLYIDGGFIHTIERACNMTIDYLKMLAFFQRIACLVHAQYYISIPAGAVESMTIKPLVDWLSYNGYIVRETRAGEYVSTHHNDYRVVESHTVQLTVDLLTMDQRITHALVIAGQSHYSSAIEAAKNRGTTITLLGHREFTHDLVRRASDNFVDLPQLMLDEDFIRHPRNVVPPVAVEGKVAVA